MVVHVPVMKYLLLSTHTPDVCARNHRYFCAINYNKTPGFEVRVKCGVRVM